MDSWMYAPATGSSKDRALRAESNHTPNFSAIQAVLARDSASPTSPETLGAKQSAGLTRIRRRNRLITSCLECRRRKLKCDKLAPCTNCVRFKRDCLYLAPSLDSSSQQKLADLKERMGALEKNLEREVANSTQKSHMGGANVTKVGGTDVGPEDDEEEEIDPNEDEDTLEPTPLASLDQVYEDNGDDELMDLGVQLGKMRISERIGGWIRPKLVDELNDTLEDVQGGKSRHSVSPMINDHLNLRASAAPKLQASPKSYIGPGPDYIAPSNGFFFPGTNMNTTLIDYLPTKTAADQLIAQYWTAVHHMCKLVHRPTFEAQYTLFWAQIATGNEPVASVQAIMFAAMLSAAVSLTNEQVMQRFGTTKNGLVDSLRSGTEMALAKANFLRTTKIDTMQAFVMYLVPLIRGEVSRAHSALVGTAIRLAECMGLHRDGSFYNMTPVAIHVRRLIWHQLCFLDMKTCDATGPRPQIRREDYDTKMPLNVDDVDLLGSNAVWEDKTTWTDSTFFRIRCECIEMRRQTWFDIVQIDKKKKSLTATLVKIQKFIASMREKYLPMMDQKIPFQALARLLFDGSTSGLHIQVLHRYLFSTAQRMPDRLRQVLIEAGLVALENAIAYETNSSMQAWTWYRGAYNQYHAALLLMVEVYAYPMRKEAARIWKCLDYIFEIPPHLAPKQKAELVITDLRDRMEVYHQMRKLKVSNQMEQRISSTQHSRIPPPPSDAPSIVDSSGQMRQHHDAMPATNFSPPHHDSAQSNSDGSRQGSVALDSAMSAIDDIDWAEWDEVFHPEINTGDLNVPDFDMADFTGGGLQASAQSASSGIDATVFGVSGPNTAGLDFMNNNIALNLPTAEDLSDVTFTPTLIPDHLRQTMAQQQRQQQQQWRDYYGNTNS